MTVSPGTKKPNAVFELCKDDLEKPAYLQMVLTILENVVDDCSMGTGIQKNSLVGVSNIVNRKRTVPSE